MLKETPELLVPPNETVNWLWAAPLSVTVHDDELGATMVAGEQARPVGGGLLTIATVDPLATAVIPDPFGSAATGLRSETEEEVLEGEFDTVKMTLASTPSEIALVFRLYITHISCPAVTV